MPTHEQSPAMVARVAALLRALGASEPTGASTTELGKLTGLARPTAHRLLTSLAAEGWSTVTHEPVGGRSVRSCTSWARRPEIGTTSPTGLATSSTNLPGSRGRAPSCRHAEVTRPSAS